MSSLLVLVCGSSVVIVTRIVVMIATRHHWKCHIAQEIKQNVRRQLTDKESEQASKIICKLENVPFKCPLLPAKHCPYYEKESGGLVSQSKFLRHLSSCIFTEIYLSWHFKRLGWFTFLVFGMVSSILLPFITFASSNTETLQIAMLVSMVLFYVMPVYSFFTILICLPFLLISRDVASIMTLLIFVFWTTLLVICLLESHGREKYDEVHLVKEVYTRSLGQIDGHIAMKLRGYCKFEYKYLLPFSFYY